MCITGIKTLFLFKEKCQKAGAWFSSLAELTSCRSSHWDLHWVLGIRAKQVSSVWMRCCRRWEQKQHRLCVLVAVCTLHANSTPSHRVTLNAFMFVCIQGIYDSHCLVPSAGKLRLGNDSGWSPPSAIWTWLVAKGCQPAWSQSAKITWWPCTVLTCLHVLMLSCTTPLMFHPKNLCMARSTRGPPEKYSDCRGERALGAEDCSAQKACTLWDTGQA